MKNLAERYIRIEEIRYENFLLSFTFFFFIRIKKISLMPSLYDGVTLKLFT